PRAPALTSQSERPVWLPWLVRALPPTAHVWSCCVILLGLRLMVGWLGLRGLRLRNTKPLPDALRDVVRRVSQRLGMADEVNVLGTDAIAEPVAFGLHRPVVLLPVSLLTRCPQELVEAMIAHELAHIRRHDLWVNLFQRVVETLLFYHPAVWWASGRMRLERELCCDDVAVGATRRRADYAEALVALTETKGGNMARVWAMGMFNNRLTLLSRVRRVLQLPQPPQQA
ncbi:MAG: M56 family metallopeptidase, partial [bacterium]|nr:M56 family metallopeptidase [bacterium]